MSDEAKVKSEDGIQFPERPQIRFTHEDIKNATLIAHVTGLRTPSAIIREALRVTASVMIEDEFTYLYFDPEGYKKVRHE